jgi:putative ABC transport system permease protein
MTATLWRVVVRAAARRPLQSLLFVLGVALGVAMIVAIDLANGSAGRAFGLFTESIAGRATHTIDGGPSGLPDRLYTQLKVDLKIREAAPVVDDYVQVLEFDSQPIHVFGVDAFAEPPFRNYLASGGTASSLPIDQLTGFLVQPNTALISEVLATQRGLKVGGTLTLRYGATRHTVTIVGLLRTSDSVAQQGLLDLLITDVSTAQEILGKVGRLSKIDLIVPPGADGSTMLARISAILSPGAAIIPATATGNAVAQMTDAFNLSLTALSLLALVVGMFLIYNTVTFSVVQRRPVLGTLRALGVTRGQVFAMILAEAAILSMIGAVIGLAIGVIMGRLAVGLVTQTVSSLYFTVQVRSVDVAPFTLLKGFVIGIAAALIAALAPAYEATTTPPASALKRSEIEGKVLRAVPIMTGGGVALLLLTYLLMSTRTLVLNFAGLFALIVGCALFTPIAMLGLMVVVRGPLGAVVGVLGRMAPRSILRSLSRTSVAVAALMVAVSVIVGVSAMVGSFRGTVQDWLETTIRADIVISPPSISANKQELPVDPIVGDQIAALPGIKQISIARNVSAPIVDDPLPASLNAITYDISEGKRKFAWSIGTFDQVWAAMQQGAVVVTETFASSRKIPAGPGQSVTFRTDKGPRTFPIAGVVYDYGATTGSVLMEMGVYRASWDDKAISTVAVFVQPGTDVTQMVATIRALFAGKQELIVRSNKELLDSVLVIFDQTFMITTALNLLATVVAFIGILAALMALQLERRRELGTMRANGLTRWQLFRMTLLETGLMGAVAGLLAVPVGTVLAWVLIYIINVRSFGWSIALQLKPEFYTQALVVAMVAALLAGIYPAIQMGRVQPSQALRSE